MNHLLRRSAAAAPAAAYLFTNSIYDRNTFCDANIAVLPPPPPPPPTPKDDEKGILSNKASLPSSIDTSATKQLQDKKTPVKEVTHEESNKNDKQDEEPTYHQLFPLRQLWKPNVEYPLWDENWDGRMMESTGNQEKDREMKRFARKNGVTRHIILIRHGQYDETHKEDEKRILTPLGRKQAELTGQRLAKMIQGFDEQFGPCNIKTIRVSNMARAKETAELIAKSLPESVVRTPPDANLNEGRPCHHIPGGRVSQRHVKITDEGHGRIEEAFKTYFYRSDPPPMTEEEKEIEEDDENEDELKTHPQHEFEIIVCHANVIRYFLCRALQIPPEAWLRLCTFNCSLTYLTIRPSGTVSCRMLGDIGHLGYEHSTFSMHHGFNW